MMNRLHQRTSFNILLTGLMFFSVMIARAQCTAPTSTVTANTSCITSNGTITFTGPAPAGNFRYSIDGGNSFGAIGQTVFPGLTGGTYPTVAKNLTTNCISGITNKTITNPVVSTPASTVAALTNCTTPNGSITFTGPTPTANYAYSIDGGNTFGAAGQTSFPNLAAGTYATVARLTTSGCKSSAANKVVGTPTVTAPTSATANVTNCNTPNGSITFSKPTPLANYSFSVDGGNTFGSAGQVLFPGLPAGTYATVAKLVSSGCVSATVSKTIGTTSPAAPTATAANVTNCNTPNGSLTFTAPTPVANYSYSIDGGNTFGTAGQTLFPGLTAGTYATVARLTSSGCISAVTSKNINNPTITAPAATVVNVTNCSAPNGSLNFTAPTPTANYSYSIDGGNTFGTAGQTLFPNLAAGTYAAVARLNSSGCLSGTTSKTINNPVNAGANQSICRYQSVTMAGTATGAATWTASGANPAPTVIANPASATTSVTGFTASGNYNYTYATAGCSSTVTIAVSDCNSPLGCVSSATLFQTSNPGTSNTDIISIDLATGVQHTIYPSAVTAPLSVNGVGYNLKDDEIWGSIQNTNLPIGVVGTGTIFRVGADGIVHTFSVPGLYNGGYNCGTVDSNGILYLYQQNANKIYKVDVNPASPTYLTLVGTINTPAMDVADIAYNITDNLLYAIDNSGTPHVMYRVNPATGTVTTVGNVLGGSVFNGANFGASYVDAQGNFYCTDNQTGNTYVIDSVQGITGAMTPQLLSTGSPSSGNDGALCPYACIIPDAGADQSTCITNPVATLAATQSSGRTWITPAGNPGVAIITNPSSATSTVTNLTATGVYYFVWSNGACGDTMAVTVFNCMNDTVNLLLCPSCSGTVCATPNPDFPADSNTVATTCGLTQTGASFGSISVDSNGCALWNGNGTQTPSDIVRTCITNCNGQACDTTFIVIRVQVSLPVTLAYFNGITENCHSALSWQTADEKNSKEYSVERSTGNDPWVTLYTLPATGNSAVNHDYSYTDQGAPSGRNLYRLRITDLDGKTSYSRNVALTNNCNTATLSIFPNPASAAQGITIRSSGAEELDYQVFNMMGALVQKGQCTGQTTITGLQPGIYMVKASSTSVSINQRIMIR